MNIRRLTPIECERLQAFPDDWTKVGLARRCNLKNCTCVDGDGRFEIEISDTQRYKCLGNAVTVNVIEAIIQKLL